MKLNKSLKNKLIYLVVAVILLNLNTFSADAQLQTEDQDAAAQSDEETIIYGEEENENEETADLSDEQIQVESNEQNAEADLEQHVPENEIIETGEAQEETKAAETDVTVSARQIQQLDEKTVIVSTYKELDNALSNNNGYTYIYLAGNIEQSNSDNGIIIHPSKASVVIDGLAPESSAKATYTQRPSTIFSDTIRVEKGNKVTRNIHLQNINILGKNKYGVVNVSDGVTGLSITYENIIYIGPQITFNPNGSAHFINSSIRIESKRNFQVNHIAEAAHITFSGLTRLYALETKNPMFRLTGSTTSMTLNPGARVIANTNNYFIHAGSSNPVMTVQNGASLIYEGMNYGLLYDKQQLKSLHLYEDSELRITQKENSYEYGTLRVAASIQADPGSMLYIERSSEGPAIQLIDKDASATFNRPERVMLYASSKNLIAYSQSGTLSIDADAVNIWTTSEGFVNDSLDNIPSKHWNKAGDEVLKIRTMFFGTTQILGTNISTSDPTTDLTGGTFTVGNSQMLVFGRIGLDIEPIYVNSKTINGTTEQMASLQVHNMNQGNILAAEGRAEGGVYALHVLYPLKFDDKLSVLTYDNYLRMVQHTTVQEAKEGILRLVYVPATLDFGNVPIPSEPDIVTRSNQAAWNIEIEDTRISSSGWILLASIEKPLSAEADGRSYTLDNGLVFVDTSNNSSVLSDKQTQIASGVGSEAVSWEEKQGILLRAYPGQIRSGVNYTTTIVWSLQDAP